MPAQRRPGVGDRGPPGGAQRGQGGRRLRPFRWAHQGQGAGDRGPHGGAPRGQGGAKITVHQ
eukprot:220875-Chlamydomonas_euryale.AAC.1